MQTSQRGGTLIGLIAGLILGLGAALAVAIYVAKVPVPFLSKNGMRTADQDAAEAQKNKNWDPNSPLYGKNPARPAVTPEADTSAEGREAAPVAPKLTKEKSSEEAVVLPAAPAEGDTAKPATEKDKEKTAASKPESKRESSAADADPLGALAKAKAGAAGGDAEPFNYFIQAGAFRTQGDADAQKAKLAMMGWEARVSEREQNGRVVFRVRVGPFAKRTDAEQFKDKLAVAGVESALVRVPR